MENILELFVFTFSINSGGDFGHEYEKLKSPERTGPVGKRKLFIGLEKDA